MEHHFFTVWKCVSSETLVTDTLHPCITLCVPPPPLAPGITMFPRPQLFQNGHIFCIVSISSFPPHPHQGSSHLSLLRNKDKQWFVLEWHLTDQGQATGRKTRRSFVGLMHPKKAPKSTTNKHGKAIDFWSFWQTQVISHLLRKKQPKPNLPAFKVIKITGGIFFFFF